MDYNRFTHLWQEEMIKPSNEDRWPSAWNADNTWDIIKKLQSMTPQEFKRNSIVYGTDNIDEFWDLKDEGAIVLYQDKYRGDTAMGPIIFINFNYYGTQRETKGLFYLILRAAPHRPQRSYNINSFSRHSGITLESLCREQLGADKMLEWIVLRKDNINSFLNWINENPLEVKQ